MIKESTENCEKDKSFIINDYLRRENPICREERQFALFLFNRLKENNRKIMNYLDIQGEIVDVFFEVTLMRDYWHTDKVCFNQLLKDYIEVNFCKNGDFCEIGDNKKVHIRKWKKSHAYGKWMMNAKPDIGLINRVDGKYYLHFIECKYLSNESIYKCAEDGDGNQIKTQKDILDFLCNFIDLKYEERTGEKQDVQKGEVIKVKFNKIESSKTKDASGYFRIKIEDLF